MKLKVDSKTGYPILVRQDERIGKIACWICEGQFLSGYYKTFFRDKNGKSRFGAICKKCHIKLEEKGNERISD